MQLKRYNRGFNTCNISKTPEYCIRPDSPRCSRAGSARPRTAQRRWPRSCRQKRWGRCGSLGKWSWAQPCSKRCDLARICQESSQSCPRWLMRPRTWSWRRRSRTRAGRENRRRRAPAEAGWSSAFACEDAWGRRPRPRFPAVPGTPAPSSSPRPSTARKFPLRTWSSRRTRGSGTSCLRGWSSPPLRWPWGEGMCSLSP